MLVWRGLDGWRAEAAEVRLGDGTLAAQGTQIGVDPEPYELRYRLDVDAGFVTRSLFLTASGDGWRRRLELVRDDRGGWTASGEPLPDVYVSLDSDFVSELELDADGLVVVYPQMAERVVSSGPA